MSDMPGSKSPEERYQLAEQFIDTDLKADYPGHDTSNGVLGRTIGELDVFLTKHWLLIKRFHSDIPSLFDPRVVNESETARAELLALGIDPQVFSDAVNIAEEGIASVIGW